MFHLQYIGGAFLALMVLEVAACFTTQYLGNAVHPSLTDHCFHEDYNLTVPVEMTIYPTNIESKCFKVHCRSDFVLEMKHCDRYPNYCTESSPYDYTKPYPDCCPKVECKQNLI
ncbi:uncharacterized protein LOC142229294 isoform X1 [Haematobia irritans]|uniref:uncharacterized protein LOC142229294 isoform X1 n=1 Tax=Haematobia irritans TaxID=7368 RepID=UPI003F4FC17A